jgi:hypothetical protein
MFRQARRSITGPKSRPLLQFESIRERPPDCYSCQDNAVNYIRSFMGVGIGSLRFEVGSPRSYRSDDETRDRVTGGPISSGHSHFLPCQIPKPIVPNTPVIGYLPCRKLVALSPRVSGFVYILVSVSCTFSILTSHMDSEQRVIIRFLHREGVAPDEIRTRLRAQFGDDTYSSRSVRRWYPYVRQGWEDLHDEARPGQPLIDFLDLQILGCLEKEPFHSAYSLAEVLGVSHTTILNHLHNSLMMKISISDGSPKC